MPPTTTPSGLIFNDTVVGTGKTAQRDAYFRSGTAGSRLGR